MDINKAILGRRISRLRKGLGMRQCDLAHRCRVDSTTVSKWESGFSAPRFTILPSVATALQITLGELVEDEDASGLEAA